MISFSVFTVTIPAAWTAEKALGLRCGAKFAVREK
jgi:hypothetical protein